MENKWLQINGFNVRCYSLNTLIIGSGAASLNAAVSLHSLGQENIAIATAKWGAGTSNNAGSDKQTYYKLSLSGREPDSVREMAHDLFSGRCMHGDIALCEAQGSVQAFMKLVNLGVPFPHDKYGSWAGYKTDNDPRARATSAGPYTSRMMVRVLSDEVRKRKIKVFDNHHIVELLTNSAGSKVTGAVAIDTRTKDPMKAFVLFNAVNIVLGTGGPGDMYDDSVYPASQTGSIGMAFRAGATGQNITESQFGIASLKFRWNLSGSYQQVMPRYFSTDKTGKNEKEFLNEHFPDYTSLTKAVFLKGYEWPFDPARVSGFGSSLIDLLVWREKAEKGRRVFLDFRKNITWNGSDLFLPERLDPEVRSYLINSGSLQDTPVARLIAMNSPAEELYREHNIDLSSEPLEVGVCAQHNNGGLKGNIWWESDLRHLFPVGEVNGSHGVRRPGGSALNSGQVGSWRASEFISRRYNDPAPLWDMFMTQAEKSIKRVLETASFWLESGREKDNKPVFMEIRQRMSKAGSIIRDSGLVTKSIEEASSLLSEVKEKTGADSVRGLAECFRISDACHAHLIYLKAIWNYIEKNGRSRGSYIIIHPGKPDLPDQIYPGLKLDLCTYDRKVERDIQEVKYKKGKVKINSVSVREIPLQNLWFEKVWREYLEDKYIES